MFKIAREFNHHGLFFDVAVSAFVMLILDSTIAYDFGISTIAHGEPTAITEANSFFAIESTHLIDGALFGAIHNMSDKPLFVQGEYIKTFNHRGRQLNIFYLENPMTIMAGSYGYFNATVRDVNFDYYKIGVVFQEAT